jgi:hypothetical protein
LLSARVALRNCFVTTGAQIFLATRTVRAAGKGKAYISARTVSTAVYYVVGNVL